MIVDLSHVSVDTMRDVLGGSPEKGWKGSIAPPIFSHSSAKAICRSCPVVQECLAHSLAVQESYGVWGGLSEGERQTVLAQPERRGRPPREPSPPKAAGN